MLIILQISRKSLKNLRPVAHLWSTYSLANLWRIC